MMVRPRARKAWVPMISCEGDSLLLAATLGADPVTLAVDNRGPERHSGQRRVPRHDATSARHHTRGALHIRLTTVNKLATGMKDLQNSIMQGNSRKRLRQGVRQTALRSLAAATRRTNNVKTPSRKKHAVPSMSPSMQQQHGKPPPKTAQEVNT